MKEKYLMNQLGVESFVTHFTVIADMLSVILQETSRLNISTSSGKRHPSESQTFQENIKVSKVHHFSRKYISHYPKHGYFFSVSVYSHTSFLKILKILWDKSNIGKQKIGFSAIIFEHCRYRLFYFNIFFPNAILCDFFSAVRFQKNEIITAKFKWWVRERV